LIQNEVTENIYSRRSIRRFSEKTIPEESVETLLECARFAPSGLNNQPWRFIVVDDSALRTEISLLTHYSDIILSAPLLISVFLDTASSYHREKDLMAVGASIQNILLAAHSFKLGAVWLGEILKNKENVSKILNAPDHFELAAVIAVGYPAENLSNDKTDRKPLNEIAFKNSYQVD
jgi:Nitroreductase